MKTKIIVAAFAALAASGSYAAALSGAAVCSGTAASVAIDPAAAPAKFIQEAFNQGCSNNVYMNANENNIMAWAVTASKKGKYYFIGNTNGGAPRADTAGAQVDPATAPDPSGRLAAAEALGSS